MRSKKVKQNGRQREMREMSEGGKKVKNVSKFKNEKKRILRPLLRRTAAAPETTLSLFERPKAH